MSSEMKVEEKVRLDPRANRLQAESLSKPPLSFTSMSSTSYSSCLSEICPVDNHDIRMSSFRFPPPPPPPPKASWTPDNQFQQPETSSRGRGRGRGRGRDNDSQSRGRGTRGGNSSFSSQNAASNTPYRQQQVPSFNGLPPGSYINPAFQGNLDLHNVGPSIPSQAEQSPARTVAGHKRKLDALRGSPRRQTTTKTAPAAPSVPSFGAPLGLNQKLPLPVASSGKPNHPQQAKRTTNALGLTPLGEVQYSSSESDDDEEDVDEEAMFAEVGASLTFEHNGTVLSLKSAAELAAWKEERARNFPTQKRMAEKLEQKRQLGGERKRLLFEASNSLRLARRPPVTSPPESRLEKMKKKLAAQTASLTAIRKQVAKSEARVAHMKETAGEVQAAEALAQAEELGLSTIVPVVKSRPAENDPPKTEDQEPTDAQRDQHQNDDQVRDSVHSPSSSESSVISSDSDDSDDDGPPEEVSSKQSKEVSATKKILCRDYVATGRCRDGDSCRFKHELPGRGTGSAYREDAEKEQKEKEQQRKAENNLHDAKLMESRATDRKSIFQRLVEQEHVGEDLLALQVIKALGKAGFFAESAAHVRETKDVRTFDRC